MAIQLFILSNVPFEEAEDIRQLLDEMKVDYHETSDGFLGLGTAAIWLNDTDRFDEVKLALEEYQAELYKQVHGDYERLKLTGKQKTVFDLLLYDPLRVILYLIAVVVILYFSIMPFLYFSA